MKTTKITKAEAIRLLEQAIAEKGKSYKDPSTQDISAGACTYVKGNKPSCIVGHALNFAGVPLTVLRKVDKAEAYVPTQNYYGDTVDTKVAVGVQRVESYGKDVLDFVKQETGVVVTPAARRVLSDAQAVQDEGLTWGEALKAAKAGKAVK